MVKNIFLSLVFCLVIALSTFAEGDNELLKQGIKSYKEGNFLGASQIMEDVVNENPGSAIAHYYLAMSYVQIGKISEAQEAYDTVIMLDPASQLSRYAQIGKKLLEESPIPEEKEEKKTHTKHKTKSPTDFYTEEVQRELEERNIKFLIEKMNRNKPILPEDYQNFKDYSPGKSHLGKPTQEEIAVAYQTLIRAGINPQMMQMENMSAMNPMMGMFSNNNSQGNNMNNLMPLLMMMQGQNMPGGQRNYDPEFMQTMVQNMVMPNMMDFSSDNKNY